jgi:hypothetical protein
MFAQPAIWARRHSGMRRVQGFAAGSVAAVTLLAGCSTATGQGGGSAAAPLTAATGVKPCDVPELAAPAPGQGLSGPAVTALTGGAATRGFSLDGGKFSIAPPPAGAAPRASRTLAECEALAAVESSGELLIAAYGVSGIAVGYGLVTVSSRLPVSSWPGHYPDIDLPTPAPARYQRRLAWVVMFAVFGRASCPTVTTPPIPAGAPYHGYYYEAFIVDAATGGAALLYDEAAPRRCNGPGLFVPSVSIPVELTSVRWQLDSRGPHDSYARLTAYVPPCDDYDHEVSVIPGTNLVPVLAYGQVAASCGPPRPVTVYVRPGGAFHTLPPTLAHLPVGLYLTGIQQPQLGMTPAAPTATAAHYYDPVLATTA